MEHPKIVRVAINDAFVGKARQPVHYVDFYQLELDRGALCVDMRQRLAQEFGGVHIGCLGRIAARRMPEIGGAGGNAVEVRLGLDREEGKPLSICRPDHVARLRVAAYADAVGGLDQDVTAGADSPDDIGVDLNVPSVLPIYVRFLNTNKINNIDRTMLPTALAPAISKNALYLYSTLE